MIANYSSRRLNVMLADLERSTRGAAGCVRLESAGSVPRVVGTRAGVLRLGAELALASQSAHVREVVTLPGTGTLEVWMSDAGDARSGSACDRARPFWTGLALLLGCVLFALVILGGVTAIRWLLAVAT